MDFETDQPNKPGNDELKKSGNAEKRLRRSVESLDGWTPSVASNVKYQYNLLATTAERGSSRIKRLERSYEDENPRPDASLSEHTEKALAFQVIKKSETTVSHPKRDLTMSDHNTNFCKPCRRIFDGNGSFVLPMTKPEKGLYYGHWDAQMLKRSARSCPLCLLVNRAMDTPVATKELIPLHYDIVGFLEAAHVYGIRFSSYVMITDGKTIVPYVAAQAMITIEAAETSLSLSNPPKGPQLALDTTTSPENHALLSEWLHTCDTSHNCIQKNIGHDRESCPTRLIDVGTDQDTDLVRLIDSKNLASIPRYLTLSHSWGSSEVTMTLQLTRQNRSSLKKQISITQLPKTFADTVLVARCLGVQYIWIDSLCIIQDDKQDWKAEAAKMWQVYASAYINIAATSSSNSSQGLFRGRNPLTTKPCVAVIREGHSLIPAGNYRCYNAAEWMSQIRTAPLSKRAWVHQEWLLSQRIIHFAQDQIFWECRKTNASESFPCGIPVRCETGLSRFPLGSNQELPKERFLEIWSSIVGEYTTRELTHVSDKLIAVSALARTLSQNHPAAGTYIAGIWGNYVIDQLSWSASLQAHRTANYRAPTWSWASMDGSIEPKFNWRHINREQRRSRSPVLVVNIDATFRDDPFDSVSTGTLKVETPLLEITIEPGKGATDHDSYLEPSQFIANVSAGTIGTIGDRPKPFADREFRFRFNTVDPSDTEGGRGRLDDDRNISERPQLYFMPLLTFNNIDSLEEPEVDELVGLMLEPTGMKRGQFKRCGTYSLDEYVVAPFLCELGNQDLEEAAYEERRVDAIGLDDMLPANWNGKDLAFIPKRFDRFVISIV